MTSFRNPVAALAILALFMAGCATPDEGGAQGAGGTDVPECRTVTEVRPVLQEECGNFSYTEPVCGVRKLNYSLTWHPGVDLCISDGVCVGQPLGDCQACTKAMSRCILEITNNELQKSGTWTVGANYTLGKAAFLKDPISMEIGPGESAKFDFNQIYNPGSPISSAVCALFVASEPTVDDCHEETRVRSECKNVTTNTTVEREVCQ